MIVDPDMGPFDDDVWELYDGSTDFSQARNLAAEQPERLAHLQRLWLIEAVKYNVIPLDDRSGERLNPDLAGRPTLIRGDSQLFFPGMGRLSENSVVSIKNKSFSVTAEIDVPEGGAEGVLIAQGGRFGGWAFYVKDGKAEVHLQRARHPRVRDRTPTPRSRPGTHQVRMEFAYDGGGLAKGGDVTLYYDGEQVGSGRVEMTQPMIFSADETTDIGYESGTTVSPGLHRRRAATSPEGSRGSRSTSATTTTTTSSTPRSGCGSPWPASERLSDGSVRHGSSGSAAPPARGPWWRSR